MNGKPGTILLFVSLLMVVLTGCTSKKEEIIPARDYRIVEKFETGRGVVVRALKMDGEYLWVGTSNGILQINRKSGDLVKTFTMDDGLLNNYIFTINVDKDGVRWFGTDSGGLSRYDGETWKTYMPKDGLSDEWVYDIDFDRNGTMWVGTWDGVSRFDGSGFKTFRVKDGLANKWVYGVAADPDGTMWFGTEEGVSHYDATAPADQAWTTYTHKDGLGAPNELSLVRKQTAGEAHEEREESIELAPNRNYAGHYHDLSPLDEQGNDTYNENYVFTIHIDRHGNKWFGTWGGGASRFDGKTWKSFSTKDGLPGDIVYAIEEDSLGQIWVGTHRGLSVYNGSSWKSYTYQDGLIGSDVFAVVTDPDGNIWIGQRGGVIQMRAMPG